MDQAIDRYRLWEMPGLEQPPVRLEGYPPDVYSGHWNTSGEYYAFVTSGRNDLWLADERHQDVDGQPKPTRLTRGPISYESPIPSSDGRRVFAIGSTERTELVSYDAARSEFEPYLGGPSAVEADFSRDGKWIAYVAYPERTLWKMRSGTGPDRTQLTFGPSRAFEPHWSPDGKRIAFSGQRPSGHRRISLIPAEGGSVEELSSTPPDQGIPTWSVDGSKLAFGDLSLGQPQSEMQLHVVDARTRRIQTLPKSRGLWTARWSPNGRWIAALTADNTGIWLFDTAKTEWQRFAAFEHDVESPTWTKNSRYIFFKAAVPGRTTGKTKWSSGSISKHKRCSSVADLDALGPPDVGWYGLQPDGCPLAVRYSHTKEIYAVTVPQ